MTREEVEEIADFVISLNKQNKIEEEVEIEYEYSYVKKPGVMLGAFAIKKK